MPSDPQLLPGLPSVRVNGVTQPALALALLDLRIDDVMGGRATCAASFVNWGATPHGASWLHVDRSLLAPQTPFALEIGSVGHTSTLFSGHLTGLAGRTWSDRVPDLVVSAEAHAGLRAVARKRVFEDMTRADVMQLLAGEHALQAEVALRRDARGTIAQAGETDLELMVRLARASGADVWVHGATLHVHERNTRRHVDDLELTAGAEVRECAARMAAVTPLSTRETTVADVLADGLPQLYPGRIVHLKGVGPLHVGRYLVTRVTHTFDKQDGFRTQCSAERQPD
jgi:DNA-binding NarL/FixJ family response regulator